MRRLRDASPYKVEVAPSAWAKVGVVPGDAFKRVKAELANVAELLGCSDPPPLANGRLRHVVRVDGYAGDYEVDEESRTLRLLDVHREPHLV